MTTTPWGALRRRAELALEKAAAGGDPQGLLHELEVHHVELELQNEELLAAQEALGAARDRWFELYELAPVGYLTLDPQGFVVQANLRATVLIGQERARLIGKSLASHVVAQDALKLARHLREVFDSDQRRSCEVTLVRGDDARCRVRLESIAGPVEGAATRECRMALLDVTAHRETEDALRRRERELLHLQRLEVLGRLAAQLAHEYRNMLMGMRGALERASQAAVECGSERETACPTQSPLVELAASAERGGRLVEQVLAIGRREHSERLPVQVDAVVGELQRILDSVLGRDVTVNVQLGAPEAWVRAGHGWIEQLILNLALNARDAMPEGGRLTISTRQRAGPRWVELIVSDSGAGMSEETRARAFEPFFTTRQGGTGLGLSTVNDLVTWMLGRITLDSGPGRGTSFLIDLPCCAAPGEEPVPVAPSSAEARSVLVVDDEKLVLLAVEHYLRSAGYRPLVASSPEDALALAEKEAVSLLLSDLSLEGGLRGLVAKLRERRPELPVIVMSAFPRDELVAARSVDPDWGLVEKPFSQARLVEQIEALLPRQ